MFALNLKPAHKAVQAYYDELQTLGHLNFYTEGAVSPAFAALLRHCAKQCGLTLVEQYPLKKSGAALRLDGALVDNYTLPHGYWEAKDTADDLDKEIAKKFAAGYPTDNILFQAPHQAVLYQHGKEFFRADLSAPGNLVEALKLFFAYQPPAYEDWGRAVAEFKDKLPQLAADLLKLIRAERGRNPAFAAAFDDFADLCRQALNPNLAPAAVEEMIIQHLLTERLFRRVFDNPDFLDRNIIARQIEKVIQTLTSRHFSRADFLKSLDRFYLAIEAAAAPLTDYAQKQAFLNTVYERFFQGFSVKVADTHGIVYTPQPLVSFMVRSVDELLRREFGRSLGDPGVHILDPFVGTGNFIVNIMRHIPRTRLEHKYESELHCNEVMLLPYYIASMNIEHCYYELTGTYRPFQGLCLVDTFELAEARQASLFTQENLERVELQKQAPIFVIIGNPPYNAWQVNENDNNKNRKYPVIDHRVSETYAKDSKATNKIALSDVYVKAIRWASDRIIKNQEGIVAFVTNKSFVDNIAYDGMRKNLAQDFDNIFVLDLGGDVRRNPKISGTTHNVFGIKAGVSINFFIRKKVRNKQPNILYSSVDQFWRKEQKYDYLDYRQDISNIDRQEITPNQQNTWLTEGLEDDFYNLLPLGTKLAKLTKGNDVIFKIYSSGIKTNRDVWAYNFSKEYLFIKVKSMIDTYNDHLSKWVILSDKPNIDNFVNNNPKLISWSAGLKNNLVNNKKLNFDKKNLRLAIYRPFTKKFLYFDKKYIECSYKNHLIFPTLDSRNENSIISVPNIGGRTNFFCFCTNFLTDVHFISIEAIQCFPFYIYDEDGGNRRENLTDWALEQFRAHYADPAIVKWDIFHYIYALLHHPRYREKYAANLKRELPRLPYAPDFWGFAKAGARLAEIHVNYESQPEYPLEKIETPGQPLNWRVAKMKLSKDKTAIVYNDFLTLAGVPPRVFDYKLGNRSALEWLIDQYKVSTDKRSGIASDPNRADDPQYIVRLLGQIVTVSLETLQLIDSLPPLE